ncbi:MAG: outer membrane lipoprotein-sorting protein [Puniceicoccales bacterium]|jgi:hypothetical protein|nr:outer membrane lipoprotein-sorting protein [Puniceicoccales bacterium]
MKTLKFWALSLILGFAAIGEVFSATRHKKSPLLASLAGQQLLETIQKLKASNGLNCAFIFDLKTTVGKKTERKEGKFYAQQNSNEIKLRFNFGNHSFLALGKSDDEIFCSEKSIKMTLDMPIQREHLLSFSDILLPFLDEKSCEYRHSKRVQGRNTHIIRFKEMTGRLIDIAYDPGFEAILQIEYFDEKEKLLRTFKLLNFKKAQGMWLMKSIEIKDIPNNTTTQLTIKKVAIGQAIPSNIFDKNGLEKPPVDNLVYTNF